MVHNMYHEYFILWYESKIRCAIIKWYKNLLEMPNRPCYWVKMNASSRKRAHTLYVKFQELMFDPPFFVGSLGSSVFLHDIFPRIEWAQCSLLNDFFFSQSYYSITLTIKNFQLCNFRFIIVHCSATHSKKCTRFTFCLSGILHSVWNKHKSLPFF